MTPALAAALRLAASLPVRTHRREDWLRAHPQPKPAPVPKPPSAAIISRGGKARSIRIGRTVYETVTFAARTRHKSTAKIYEWLRAGHTDDGAICRYEDAP